MNSPDRKNRQIARLIEQRHWKRWEVVDRVNAAYEQITGKPGAYSEESIRRLVSGVTRWPTEAYRRALEQTFGATTAELGLYNPRAARVKPSQTGTGVDAALRWNWGGEEVDEMQRRELMRAIAVLTAAVPAITAVLSADEVERTIRAIAAPRRVDGGVLDNIEAMLNQARIQDDLLGPQAAIGTTLTQSNVAEALLAGSTGALGYRLKSLRSKIATSAGWQLFDLGRTDTAAEHFEKARDIADEIGDDAAGAMAMAEWSAMTEEIGKPSVAADQAAAAEIRATRSGDPLLRAHTAGISALAQAKAGHAMDTRAALGRADSFDITESRTPEQSLAYFCTPGHIARMRAKSLHQIGDLGAAIEAAEESLRLQAVRDRAASHILLGTIYVDAGNLDAALDEILLGAEAANSARVSGQLQNARTLIHVRAPGSEVARTLDARMQELQQI
ncbi:tetratricopeptide (TPR) repeat protein [Nocardia transvalensis]|uniref:Tetratricopeptide (TPR) repeat protein n=1 Tax=Nocardia transvalensis TaxID=37333 RepID=A0A7W9PCI9_9NOCA|nr:hypothetical protein [Nocardia transvalensis]MBB5913183.1 tetratricopeptide (TPR) repeat protein [Nocardia transvalensis]